MEVRRQAVGRLAAPLAMAAWIAITAAGFRALDVHERTPGEAGRRPGGWPEGSSLGRSPGVPNLVMAVHPRCPCSRASLAMLAEVAARSESPRSLRLLVFRPEDSTLDWAGGSFVSTVDAIAGAIRVDDPGGHEATRFGLSTSGGIAAFDGVGRLRFSGGLTAARGREAPSEGAAAIASILAGREPTLTSAPIFGCGLGLATRRSDPRRAEP